MRRIFRRKAMFRKESVENKLYMYQWEYGIKIRKIKASSKKPISKKGGSIPVEIKGKGELG